MTDRKTASTITDLELDQLYDERDRLRAGEEPGWSEAIVPTPGQWIARWNQASPTMRLHVAEAILRDAETASRCVMQDHERRTANGRHAEAALARVRALRDSWRLMTLEPGQVRRLLDGITHALDGTEQPTTED